MKFVFIVVVVVVTVIVGVLGNSTTTQRIWMCVNVAARSG